MRKDESKYMVVSAADRVERDRPVFASRNLKYQAWSGRYASQNLLTTSTQIETFQPIVPYTRSKGTLQSVSTYVVGCKATCPSSDLPSQVWLASTDFSECNCVGPAYLIA